MTPLPELDISTPETAKKSLREYLAWEKPVAMTQEQYYQIEYVRCGLDMFRFPNAHQSEAAKQLVQDSIDKLKEMLAPK